MRPAGVGGWGVIWSATVGVRRSGFGFRVAGKVVTEVGVWYREDAWKVVRVWCREDARELLAEDVGVRRSGFGLRVANKVVS